MSHKTKRGNASATCVFFGVILALFSITAFSNWRLTFADREDLTRIVGRIDSIKYLKLKTGTRIHIIVRGQSQTYHLVQYDLSCMIPAMDTLKVGDSVVAFGKQQLLRRDMYWLWEIARDGVLVASFEQTIAAKAKDRKADINTFFVFAAASTILFVVGFSLRNDSRRESA